LRAAFLVSQAHAQGLLKANRISADLANQAVAAVVAKCASQGYAETGVLVDADGVQQATLRGNRAGAHTLDSAFAKAYTSASFKTDTTALVERSKTVPVLANLFKLPHLPFQAHIRQAPGGSIGSIVRLTRPDNAKSQGPIALFWHAAFRIRRPRLETQGAHHAIVAVIALQHGGAPERHHRRAFAAKQRHRRRLSLRVIEACEVADGDLTRHRQRVADGVPVAAERTDDVREDCLVIRARHAVFSAGGTMKAASRRRSRNSAYVS
jgi:uncharacterized protein GlcG (DUF336 family)